MYIQLLRQLLANPATGGAAYLAATTFWDTVTRTYYQTLTESAVSDPAELAVGAEVDRWELRPGVFRVVKYAGFGRVNTVNLGAVGVGGVAGGSSTLLAPTVQPNPVATSGPAAADGVVYVTPGGGSPPYAISVTRADTAAVVGTGTAKNALQPPKIKALPIAALLATVTDASGASASTPFQVVASPAGSRPYGLELANRFNASAGTGTYTMWNPASEAVEHYDYSQAGTDDFDNYTPAGQVVDQYLLPDGHTYRYVKSDGQGDVFYDDTNTAGSGTLELDNLILFHPDTPTEPGGCLIEVIATSLPVTYSVGGQTNQTGRFDGLPAGDYVGNATDAGGRTVAVPFSLALRYGPRWVLAYDDLDGNPLRLELWLRGYAGPVEKIFGQGEAPVVLRTDGLNGQLGGQGDIPVVVGTSAELSLLVLPGTLENVVVSDDRACRCDVYAAGALQFRGYITPDVYTEPLLSGYLPIALTATDGLASLKDTYFLGHIGQRLGGRYPLLHSLLHCLSRCDVALPLLLAVNRRSTEMSDADAPELAATTDRFGYWNQDNEPTDCRAVVDALAQLLGGTLIQRQGRWQVRSPLEAGALALARPYRPAGNALAAATVAAPAGAIVPPQAPGAAWWWQGAGQQKQLRPGWKSLVGTSDAGYLPNAFLAGEVFNDKYAWLPDFGALRPLAGWHPGPVGGFPLLLTRVGSKGTDHSTQWPRLAPTGDERYFESRPLPLVPAPESCPAYLTVSGRLVPAAYLNTKEKPAVAGTATAATFALEIVIDGQRPAQPLLLNFPLAAGATAKDTDVLVPLLDKLPAGAKSITFRVYPWYALPSSVLMLAPVYSPGRQVAAGDTALYNGQLYQALRGQFSQYPAPTGLADDPYWQQIPATDRGQGLLLVTRIALQLRPQEATWNGADNFRADGPAGTVRPTAPLAVFHPDVPVAAGLFEGNRYAFAAAVALSDGSLSTAWARALDVRPAPVFEANVYDALVLRSGPSRLLTGTVRHRGQLPPLLLDAVDTPADVAGRRFCVGATAWNLKQATAEVSLLEIGAGAGAPNPLAALPAGVRLTHRAYEYSPGQFTYRARAVHGGGWRVRH